MFAKLASTLLVASAFTAGVSAKPVLAARGSGSNSLSNHMSFNNWGGMSSFNGFDNFYGVDNFDSSSHFTQVVEQQQSVVCHTQEIEIIQQRLLVLQEMAKRIILEQVCEVETQTVVFQQFYSSLGRFSGDLHRSSGHQAGYDRSIAGHFNDICSADGSLTTNDLGFSGTQNGADTVVVGGSNWNDATSPASVASAFGSADMAISSLH